MTDTKPQQTADATEQTEAMAALEQFAAEAESEERAQQQAETDAQQTAEGEWEDADAQLEQAKALAAMGVSGVEFLAGLVHPGHALDKSAREQGEASLLPVAMDFAGEVPEWLRPYLHYLAAGMWVGGVMFAAYKARRAEDAEKEKQAAEEKRRQQGAQQGAAAHGV